MKPEDRQNPEANPRRRFLLTASLGSVGAVAAMVVTKSPVAPAIPAAEPQPRGDGYRLSEHILHYYRSTRI